MRSYPELKKPSKEEQQTAMVSYDALAATLIQLKTEYPEIEIEETNEKIKVPRQALELLAEILKGLSKGRPISIVPIAAEMTTQAAADFIGCSRPHLVKLLEGGKIPYTLVGKHRRIKYEDLAVYKKQMKAQQEALLIELMKGDEELGLYEK